MTRAGGEFNRHAGDTAGCWTAVVVGNLEYGVPTKPRWSLRVCGLRVTDRQIVAAYSAFRSNLQVSPTAGNSKRGNS